MKTILVVEDSPTVLQMISDILTVKGYKVIEANNGLEALELLRSNHIDLVLVDLLMPLMNGVELIQAIRAEQIYMDIPIVMQTAQSHASLQQEGMAAGANGWIVKPFDPGQLVSSFDRFLKDS